MGAWDYELARELRGLGRGAGRTEILEGTVVATSPLTVSLFGGEGAAGAAANAVLRPRVLPGRGQRTSGAGVLEVRGPGVLLLDGQDCCGSGPAFRTG